MNEIKVGFIGLGLMGSGFTTRLVEQGYSVYGYDKIAEKTSNAESQGVQPATSPREMAQTADQLHICIMTADDLDDVVFGEHGLSTSKAEGKIVVDHSTTSAATTRDFALRLKNINGMDWIDAPVSGGPAAALDGTLAIMAGGKQDVVDRAMPVLQTLGECTRMGDIGAGQVTKMVNQVLVLNNYCILAEALALAEAGGVEPARIPQALAQGHAGSNLLQRLFPRMIARDYEPAGYAFQVLKDLNMVDELASSLKVPTPMSAQATSLFRRLNEQGHGELDGISVLKLYEEMRQAPD